MDKLVVSSSPHIRGKETTESIMMDVFIALMPAAIMGAYYFGIRAIAVVVFSVICCMFFEGLYQKLTKKPVTVFDFSAAVTGILLGLNLPVTIPFWMVAVGSLFAIVIVKQIFGGIGHNFINPALAARAFMLASWPQAMTHWVQAGSSVPIFGSIDAVSSATVLGVLKTGESGTIPSYLDMFLGNMGGSLGETCALALLLGGLYLVIKRVISLRIPLSFIATVFIFTTIAGPNGLFTGDGLMHILSGGVILGAFFMATDYVTSPMTAKGQIIMGIGCGLITSIIRLYGGYPEGVSYSILLMNIVTPLIDRSVKSKKYGGVKNA